MRAGNPHYLALPWLPYRLVYAYHLAEAGHVSQATAYCTRLVAIFEKIPKPPPGMMVAKSLTADLATRLTMHAQVSLLARCLESVTHLIACSTNCTDCSRVALQCSASSSIRGNAILLVVNLEPNLESILCAGLPHQHGAQR